MHDPLAIREENFFFSSLFSLTNRAIIIIIIIQELEGLDSQKQFDYLETSVFGQEAPAPKVPFSAKKRGKSFRSSRSAKGKTGRKSGQKS